MPQRILAEPAISIQDDNDVGRVAALRLWILATTTAGTILALAHVTHRAELFGAFPSATIVTVEQDVADADKHMAQLQHNMWVTNAKGAALSIITGGGKWVEISIAADSLYQHVLLTAEKKFWRCVETGDRPGASSLGGGRSGS